MEEQYCGPDCKAAITGTTLKKFSHVLLRLLIVKLKMHLINPTLDYNCSNMLQFRKYCTILDTDCSQYE